MTQAEGRRDSQERGEVEACLSGRALGSELGGVGPASLMPASSQSLCMCGFVCVCVRVCVCVCVCFCLGFYCWFWVFVLFFFFK